MAFAKGFARQTGAVIAITGSIDIVADGERTFCIRNGRPEMSSIAGTGCQLSALTAACGCAVLLKSGHNTPDFAEEPF